MVGCSARRPSSEEIEQLRIRVETGKPLSGRGGALWNWTKGVYKSRQFRPAWSARGSVYPDADKLIQTLENAPAEGLHAGDFALPELQTIRDAVGRSSDPAAQVEFDVHLTHSLVTYVAQLCFGRIDPKHVEATWQSPQRECDVPRIVSDALGQDNFGAIAERLSPLIPEYRALKAGLERYRGMAAQGDASAAERVEEIEINLDRMRWMPDDLGSRHIRVNVPAFELTVHDGNQVPLQMRAIVGSNDNRTPIFSGEMQSIVFSPYWNIPKSIATKELLPKIRQDVRYLERQHIEVIRASGDKTQAVDPSDVDWDEMGDNFRYLLRQKPGASNSLGLVKFIFPNPFNVYLHDTPADSLFDRVTRTLSHGCVRVEHPSDLAAYVLQDQAEWTPEHIQAAMHSDQERHVALKTRLPVHIVYWTAWAGSEGNVEFRDDVYGYDAKHRALTSR